MLYGVHISPYEQGNRFNHEPERTRKLLMHKSEINKLHAQVKEKGFSLVPLNFHFSHGYVKVTVGLVTGKKLYDKRQDMAERDAKRDIAKPVSYTHLDVYKRQVKEACDFLVTIPMYGNLNSLNASVAAAVLMYEAVRQRQAK